jgi:hypothetical protein
MPWAQHTGKQGSVHEFYAGPLARARRLLFVAQFRDRFRSLSNVNLSGSQNASKNAAAAAEKTE